MKFKGLKINTYKGEVIIDFDAPMVEIYRQFGGVPHVLLRNYSATTREVTKDKRVFNGLKFDLTKGVTSLDKAGLAQSYSYKDITDKFDKDKVIDFNDSLGQSNWELLDNYKYAVLQPVTGMNIPNNGDIFGQYDIMSKTVDRINCFIINLDNLSEEEKDNTKIITDIGETPISNYYKDQFVLDTCYEFRGRAVAITLNVIDNVVVIVDANRVYIIDITGFDMTKFNESVIIDGTSNDKDIMGYALNYSMLSLISGNPVRASSLIRKGSTRTYVESTLVRLEDEGILIDVLDRPWDKGDSINELSVDLCRVDNHFDDPMLRGIDSSIQKYVIDKDILNQISGKSIGSNNSILINLWKTNGYVLNKLVKRFKEGEGFSKAGTYRISLVYPLDDFTIMTDNIDDELGNPLNHLHERVMEKIAPTLKKYDNIIDEIVAAKKKVEGENDSNN